MISPYYFKEYCHLWIRNIRLAMSHEQNIYSEMILCHTILTNLMTASVVSNIFTGITFFRD